MNYTSIGKFSGTHGFAGELVLKHALGKKTSLKDLKALFIQDKKDSFMPWFIEKVSIKNDQELFIKLEGLNTKEVAQKLTQKEVWLPEADLKKYAAKNATISLLGYTIVEKKKAIGIIEEIIEQPHQVLCLTSVNDKEVYIPLHEETLLHIDHKKQVVEVALPEGLLDIYLA